MIVSDSFFGLVNDPTELDNVHDGFKQRGIADSMTLDHILYINIVKQFVQNRNLVPLVSFKHSLRHPPKCLVFIPVVLDVATPPGMKL